MARRLQWNMEKIHPELWKKVEESDVAICRNPFENRDQMDQGHSFTLASAGNLHNLKTTSSTEAGGAYWRLMVVAAVALFLDVFLSFSHEVISATNCIDGTLHLRGQNVVNSALVFSKDAA